MILAGLYVLIFISLLFRIIGSDIFFNFKIIIIYRLYKLQFYTGYKKFYQIQY